MGTMCKRYEEGERERKPDSVSVEGDSSLLQKAKLFKPIKGSAKS